MQSKMHDETKNIEEKIIVFSFASLFSLQHKMWTRKQNNRPNIKSTALSQCGEKCSFISEQGDWKQKKQKKWKKKRWEIFSFFFLSLISLHKCGYKCDCGSSKSEGKKKKKKNYICDCVLRRFECIYEEKEKCDAIRRCIDTVNE